MRGFFPRGLPVSVVLGGQECEHGLIAPQIGALTAPKGEMRVRMRVRVGVGVRVRVRALTVLIGDSSCGDSVCRIVSAAVRASLVPSEVVGFCTKLYRHHQYQCQ